MFGWVHVTGLFAFRSMRSTRAGEEGHGSHHGRVGVVLEALGHLLAVLGEDEAVADEVLEGRAIEERRRQHLHRGARRRRPERHAADERLSLRSRPGPGVLRRSREREQTHACGAYADRGVRRTMSV